MDFMPENGIIIGITTMMPNMMPAPNIIWDNNIDNISTNNNKVQYIPQPFPPVLPTLKKMKGRKKETHTSQVWRLFYLNHISAVLKAGRHRQMEPVFTPAVQLLSYSCNLRQRHGNSSHLLVPKQPWRT